MSFRQISLFLLLFCALSGCQKRDPVNVVIITIDTTRADHLACYGHPRARTPYIDQLASEGVLFENAFTPVPVTFPSHSTILTGKVPFNHGIRDNALFVLTEDQTTLAERLKEIDYACGAAIGAFPLLSRFGLDQGFDLYDERLGREFLDKEGNKVVRKQRLFFDERKAGLVNESVFPWMEEQKDEPFFLWLHYFDPHHPHEAPPPYSFEFADNPYLGEIAYTDECVGSVINKLKEMGVYENTLIIVTADHGEGNGEHNEPTHSMLAYNSTLHIPLIIKSPGGIMGARIKQRVGTVDLVPTIMDRIGLKQDKTLQGSSLLGFLHSEGKTAAPDSPPPLYAETLSPRLSHGLGEIRAIYDGDYKYLHGPEKELFNLSKDPRELDNLIEKEPGKASLLRKKLEEYLEQEADSTANQQIAIDKETERRLMALGYLGSSGVVQVGEERLRDDGVAPQARVADNQLLSSAKHFLYRNQPIQAREAIIDLLERAPDDPAYVNLLAECEWLSGNADAALSAYERLLEIENATAVVKPDHVLLAMAGLHLGKGNREKAVELIEESREFNETAGTAFLLATIYAKMNLPEKRYEALKQAASLEGPPAKALLDLAVEEAKRRDLSNAEKHFLAAIETEPYSALLHYNYAVFLYLEFPRKRDEALKFSARATTLSPDYIPAGNLSFQIYLEMGDREKAKSILSAAEKASPDHPLIPTMKTMLESGATE